MFFEEVRNVVNFVIDGPNIKQAPSDHTVWVNYMSLNAWIHETGTFRVGHR